MTHPPNKRRTGKEKGLAKQYKKLGVEDPDRQPTTRRSPMGKRLQEMRARKAAGDPADTTESPPARDAEPAAYGAAAKTDEEPAARDAAKEPAARHAKEDDA